MTFEPTRAAGLSRLHSFAPRMGRAYAAGRNTDRGPHAPSAVSALSPYVRYRLLLESELVETAIAHHGPVAAEKFVQEVFWRTYWKGWLEARPAVWDWYITGLARARDRLATEAGLRRVYHDATEGQTGIDGFDDWARALVADNWLHNHVRMWFASIWIFTLRLPWELGAAFFLRHLLDGDPASNTLSWRWVAGLHTVGKTYVARAENIRRHTEGRHDPSGQLDEDPAPLREDTKLPAPRRIPPSDVPDGPAALLIYEDDLQPETLALPGDIRRIGVLPPAPGRADPVAAFVAAALSDAAARAADAYAAPITMLPSVAAVADWATGLPVVAAYAPVGPAASQMEGVARHSVLRGWDAQAWPHATRGFFKLKEAIPELVRL